MEEYMPEDQVQDLIRSDKYVQDRIKELLNLKGEVEFRREDSYINGITADFTVIDKDNEKIVAIIECKAGNINLTEYVRGIGQLLQYEYCYDNKVPHTNLEYSKNFKTVYFYPDSVISKSYNIGQFKYPETTVIYVLKDNKEIQEITKKRLNKLENSDDNLIMVSPYYVRDIRVFEYYMLMRYIFLQESMGIKKINREDKSIANFFKKTKSVNTNFKNGWITLSTCGLIKRGNLLTEAGKRLVVLDYEEFAVKMYHNFLKPYFDEILNCFNDEKIIYRTLSEWEELIRSNNGNRDVCNMTDGQDTQSMSSWLNIMRDDFGMIKSEPGRPKDGVEIIYDPRDLNDEALIKKIKEYSVGYEPLKNFHQLLRKANITYDSVENYEPYYIDLIK